jgi:hypothetical protein
MFLAYSRLHLIFCNKVSGEFHESHMRSIVSRFLTIKSIAHPPNL